jgi:hypothetical protein
MERSYHIWYYGGPHADSPNAQIVKVQVDESIEEESMDWEERVQQLESEGLTRSDAQAVIDAEDVREDLDAAALRAAQMDYSGAYGHS